MQLTLTPGNSLTCRINHHRDGWNGVICANAEQWNCLAEQDFRTTFCAAGDPRCFHLHTFDPAAPRFVIDGTGASWLLDKEPHALDDQILFFWGLRTVGPRGIPDSASQQTEVLFGVYRVKEVEKKEVRHRTQWLVKPYSDGWARFNHANVARPRFDRIGGQYLTELDARDVERALEEISTSSVPWPDAADRKRFENFRSGYAKWIKVAQRKAELLLERFNQTSVVRTSAASGPAVRVTPGNKPLKELSELAAAVVKAPVAAVAPAEEAPAAAPKPSVAAPRTPALPPLIDTKARAWIVEAYGADRALELDIATRTKDLVVLRGDPGVGKSHLALRLLDDPARERSLIVPVAATWRGREDLLGYVNPIHGRFERTPFTEFLFRAAAAWRSGDKRARLVVFEEFNLSQPEYWLADVLAVSQYDDEADRKIVLAGAAPGEEREVLLSPAVRFVATVNADHTTRPLSPRVLDRAAVITLELTAKEALKRVALPLEDASVAAIADLDFLLRPKGSPFSIRTARALERALGLDVALDQAVILDLVLLQQVLSKLRLLAHDASDAGLLHQLVQWADGLDGKLPRCAAWIAACKEELDAGRDVVQA